MKSSLFSLLLSCLFIFTLNEVQAQFNPKPVKPEQVEATGFDPTTFKAHPDLSASVPLANRPLPSHMSYRSMAGQQLLHHSDSEIRPITDPQTGRLIGFRGQLRSGPRTTDLSDHLPKYLDAVNHWLDRTSADNSFVSLRDAETDELGITHQKLEQRFRGVPIYGAELIVHAKAGKPYLLNGRFLPEPKRLDLQPAISASTARQQGLSALKSLTTVRDLTAQEKAYTLDPHQQPELVIYYGSHFDQIPRLVWYAHLVPNVLEHWEVFIDAHSGEVLHQIKASCTIAPLQLYGLSESHHHDALISPRSTTRTLSASTSAFNPPTTAQAVDLKGITRTINVFFDQATPTYAMLDISQPMYDPNSTIPDNIRGGILTLDAANTNPQNNNFNANFVLDSDNQWNNPRAVSAHYHAEVAYEYYRSTFNRNSINGQGGNILSIINVAETNGANMDNAFWNGAAMFYGNGNQAFNNPLMKSLDTGGHEMTHGVVQGTAGLIYENQSGALNESFADVFGVLIDPVNWQLGEDIVNPAVFPSGALRDMSDPNQGGNGLNSPGWQPKHMNEFVDLPNTPQGDNGGVHINSGIPNHAFYQFAQAVGLDKAGRVFYRALSQYLTRSSQFIDLRLAVEQSAVDLYGNSELNAARNAFDAVGIGGGTGTTGPENLPSNEGTEFVLATTPEQSGLYLYDLTQDAPLISSTGITSRPSITDDGSVIVFVDDQNQLKFLQRNNQGQYVENFIENNPQQIWRNIAIAKDGSKIAATTTDFDNLLFVFDFNSQVGRNFEVVTPTFAQGVVTNDVQYTDIIEWDYTGENVLYDAYNVIDDDLGNSSDYWDIGVINVWDNQANDFANGTVQKVFASLPDNTSVGNPTFSKNSPFIIAFDFIGNAENFSDLALLGANIETGDVGLIYENDILSYPNYSTDDDRVVIDVADFFGNVSELNVINLNADKISASQVPQGFLQGGHWGVWFATGQRELTSTNELNDWQGNVSVSPNPFAEDLLVTLEVAQSVPLQITLYNALGQQVRQNFIQRPIGQEQIRFDTQSLHSGLYLLEISQAGQRQVVKVVK